MVGVAAVAWPDLAAALFTFHRSFDTPEDSHVVPVDLVTIADKTNVAAQAPPAPEPQKMDMPAAGAWKPPPEPQMQEVEPAPEPPMPEFKIAKEKPEPVDKPPAHQERDGQDFNALLNKLTAPDKPAKNAKAGPRVIQGIGAGNHDDRRSGRCAQEPDLSLLDPAGRRARRPRPGGGFRSAPQSRRHGGAAADDAGTAAQAAGNRYTRAAAEAASRAIYQCQPYRLPPDRYNQWREINPLRFDPRQMMNQ